MVMGSKLNSQKLVGANGAQSRPFFAVIDVPSDKSLTHRAIFFACMAAGRSWIRHPLLGSDCLATIEAFRSLGCQIEIRSDGATVSLEINSPGLTRFVSPEKEIDCGNSGTTARLLLGLLAGLPGIKATLTGDNSLTRRPMDRVVEPLRKMGARLQGTEGSRLPITVHGVTLSPGVHEVPTASAQVKSALMLAALETKGTTTIRLPRGARDHTERFLLKMGAKLQINHCDDCEELIVDGPFALRTIDLEMPGDPSSAAFFAVLAAVNPGAVVKFRKLLQNPTRNGYLKVLERMGVNIFQRPSNTSNTIEPCAEIEVRGPVQLRPVRIDRTEVPTLVDEIPILGVAALFAPGQSRFCGLAELRVKESDRLRATQQLLQAAGGLVDIVGDDLVVSGGHPLKDAICFDAGGDHRLAMAAAVLAKALKGQSTITGADWVNVSFPGFFEQLEVIASLTDDMGWR